jgi:hypothetical protein
MQGNRCIRNRDFVIPDRREESGDVEERARTYIGVRHLDSR